MFTDDEIRAVCDTVRASSIFKKASHTQQVDFVKYIAAIDETPKDKHPVMHYVIVARTMAESLGSVIPSDYGMPQMRDLLMGAMKPKEKPYNQEGEKAEWKTVEILPVHIVLALKVIDKATAEAKSVALDPGQASLTASIESYVKSQQAALDKEKKKGTLSFNLANRITEVGLGALSKDALPSEEAMIKLEDAGKAARDKGRLFIGSVEGEDLQQNFRPSWTRTPKLDVLVGEGSIESKLRAALDARKSRSTFEKTDFVGFATFQGHLLDWGFKMIIMKVISPVQLLAYQHILIQVAEEWGGARTAYLYDILQRQQMAKALEIGESDLGSYLTTINRDLLSDAKRKIDLQMQEAGRTRVRNAANPPLQLKGSKGGSGGKGGKGGGKLSKSAGAAGDKRSRSPAKVPWGQGRGKDQRPSWERTSSAAGSKGGKGRTW